MAFNSQQKNGLIGAVVVLSVAAIILQNRIDPLRNQAAIEPPTKSTMVYERGGAVTLPFEYTLGALTGFREVIAGLLWVRTDEFFHDGNYDAILPMIRLITWLDPNWLDVYATGAWHMMYNFTDTDQRSDRRYLGPGMALLNEGIANNPDVYDMYKEKGWNAFDKLKDYSLATEALQSGEKADPKYDVTQIGHLLAHSLERSGRIDEAIAQWKDNIAAHKARMADPNITPDEKNRNEAGLNSSVENLNHDEIREIVRKKDTQPPIDIQFVCTVTRLSPKVLRINGSWRCWGTSGKAFDMGTPEHPGKGLLMAGPADGARVDVRLQDQGYVPQTPKAFSFDIDESVTIMQDQISTRDGKLAKKGGLFQLDGRSSSSASVPDQSVNVYPISSKVAAAHNLGAVPISQGLPQLSPLGRLQAVSIAYPLPYGSVEHQYTPAEVETKFTQLKGDAAKLADLDKKHYCVAQADMETPATYSREFDMSKDPTMYSFSKDKYDLIISLNPRNFPDPIQDRFGLNGEGLTDKNYLFVDKTKNNLRMIRRVITLSREDLTGAGEKVLVAQ